ncbi:putative A Receptor for Ubiquitination Targets [Lyophyllum shimeji]|uniref:A Receptor for Ubiquitination Targets n=1 Tax=Lyophyllum shimeji TaxID=47721 RepID=A0A9P3PS30_LYOSH|nr:putative A Receptor for Ubiquitination Targets [Lyophyllum shimeji]
MASHLPPHIPQRRPGRYKPRAWVYLSETEPPTPPSLDYFEHDLRRVPPVKRHVTTDVKRGHVADLRSLKIVPLDVLFEIFSNLHPLDLLHLARTSKRLRAILMSRSSISIWRAALANVERLPFCPSDLTETQYVDLLFGEHCHFCLATNAHQIFWACRVRCCNKCVNKYFVPEYVLAKFFPQCLQLRRLNAIFPYALFPGPGRYKAGRIMYYLPVAEEYIREFEIISHSETAVAQWTAQKALEQAARIKHARLCEAWIRHWYYPQSQDHNLVIIFFLSILLVVFWKDKLLEFMAPSPPIFIR